MFIIDLADRPEAVEVLAAWLRREWEGAYRGRTQREVEESLEARLHRDRLPVTLLAIEGNDLIGAVSLVEISPPTHAHLGPWIGGLYVVPERRGGGVATELVEAAVERAGRLGFERVYIAIGGGVEHYRAHGWSRVERAEIERMEVFVLVRELGAGRKGASGSGLTSAMPSRSSHTL